MIRLENLPNDEYVYDDLSLTLKGKSHTFTIGDELNVIVANANTRLRQVDFVLAGVERTLKNCIVKKKNSNKIQNKKRNQNKNKKTYRKKRK